ncbi:MAG: phosphonoacetaldehyde reductase, partial [Thermoplasmatales archaeon]
MQKEFFGYGSIQKLDKLIKECNPKNIFLITGKKSYTLSGAEEKIIKILKDIKYKQFNSFSTNPTLEDVEKGIRIFKKAKPQLVLAIGGGSVIDIAKAINALAFQKQKPEIYITGKKDLEKQGLPLIAIPATAGTGSESTRYSTIYIDKEKYSLTDEKYILPTSTIIDPFLTQSLPKYITAYTGLDALCQGIESLWSINSTEESTKYAELAINRAFSSIVQAVQKPTRKSRIDMARAANYSGKAINITKTTSCHSISYPITSYFNIPHGHAVALTMPEMLEFNFNVSISDCNDKRGVYFVKKKLKSIFKMMKCKNEIDAKNSFKYLMEK